MIALIFVTCLQSDPEICRERNLVFASETLTPQRCLMHAQFRLAEWAQSHPRWQIQRWKCGRIQYAGKSI